MRQLFKKWLSEAQIAEQPFWDQVGIVLSGACLIHCLVLPFATVFLTLWGLDVFLHESVHQLLVAVLMLTSALAFVPGYMVHKRRSVFYWMAPGLGTLFFTSFFLHRLGLHAWEMPLNVLGGACLIRAHVLNRTFCKACSNCDH